MTDKYQNKYRIASARAPWHGYDGGVYFVTICTAGKKHYFGHVTIPLNQREKVFNGKQLELKIPNEDYGRFEIYLGLELSPEERKYNNRTFDIKYQFEESY